MNVGIRTLGESVVLSVASTTADGAAVEQTVPTSYLPNFYEQTTAQSFARLSTLPPGGTIKIFMIAGKAIVNGTTTDNRTNDSNMQLALPAR